MLETIFFFLFAALAIVLAFNVVLQRNPLYGAIALIGVFINLACLYVMLASPFIAAVQILVYAGAIMVLVVFVIMLLNVEEDLLSTKRLKSLPILAAIMGLALAAQAFFIFYAVERSANNFVSTDKPTMGFTIEIGKSLFTQYLLPFEATGLLLLMAIIGSMMMARRLQPQKIEEIVEQERKIHV
ncbi:MAG: NADH-quinone oxidoreductase subunit J [Pyrinomonadaceae bacterium]|nr:NADH-quinone oxidoreductase subunit J [Pyrinomonadaceae bacterium]